MAKGDSFERDMCRYLSLWLTCQKRNDVLWRNRLRKTVMSPDGKHQLGDVMTTDPIGQPFVGLFNVELKTGYSKTKRGTRVKNIPWDLLDLIDHTANKKGSFVIIDFWEQTENDAELSKRIPMLIFSRDYHVEVVCIANDISNSIYEYAGKFIGDSLGFFSCKLKEPLIFFRADDFFEWLTPEIVELMYNKKEGKYEN